jgi:1,4-alpha-glucan branching enzyme
MPGDEWQRYANLRLLFGYMYGMPGKKLLFMGGEFAQWPEWNHDRSLDWHALGERYHAGTQRWIKDLNHLYQREPALYEQDCSPEGFQWVDFSDRTNTTLFFLRKAATRDDWILAGFNFTPTPRHNYRVGVPRSGQWDEVLNSDAETYGGSGLGNYGGAEAARVEWHHRPYSLSITLPPLAAVFFLSRGANPLTSATSSALVRPA